MKPPFSQHERVLIACIGNIFHGDDGFGCEVARRLASRPAVEGARVIDFGIRSYDLAFAILDTWELVILVDATPRGGAPGTLYVIEPDLAALEQDTSAGVDTHAMQPAQVLRQALRMARAFGGALPKILLVGCEPGDLGDLDEGKMGVSDAVAAAVGETPPLLDSLVATHLAERALGGCVGTVR